MWERIFDVEWETAFIPGIPAFEIFLRGTIIYLFLFIMLRFTLIRASGAIGITDLLVVVLIANASQNAMSKDYRSITDGLLLVMTILFWAYGLEWLGYRFALVERLISPPPLPLVKEGQMIRRNMRREFITEGELMGQLRLQGVEELSHVKHAYMEADGRISVIRWDEDKTPHTDDKRSL